MTEAELAEKRLAEFNAIERRKRRIMYTFLAVLFLALGVGGTVVVLYGLDHGVADRDVGKLGQIILGSVFMLGAGGTCAFKAVRGK